MHVFDEMRNSIMCKEDSVQILKIGCRFKHHQFAPTMGLMVTVKVKFFQVHELHMTGVSQMSFKFVTAITRFLAQNGRMQDLANSQDVDLFNLHGVTIHLWHIYKCKA